MSPVLVIGTHNAKKGKELEMALAPHGIQVATLADYPQAIEVEETGETFAENARLKASQQASHLGQWVLADDSGIEVDELGGAPGVYSARFAAMEPGNDSSGDEANNRLLLEKLAGVPAPRRGARYFCHIALADPNGDIRAETTGQCRGRIIENLRGNGGFGYDPLFEIREYHRTFGEMGPSVKKALSHRSRAMRAILPKLLKNLNPSPTSGV